jgi:Restriction endonuclease NotI
MAKPKNSGSQLKNTSSESGNHISEWLGHRIYPTVKLDVSTFVGPDFGSCPFLTDALGQKTNCVKSENSFGVCSVSSASNGSLQDWLVCPYRVVSSDIVRQACLLIFGDSAANKRPKPVTLLKNEMELTKFKQEVVELGTGYVFFKTSSEARYPS